MNYADEPYVRLYTRSTVTWKLMSFEARTLMMFMLRNGFDRSGALDVGGHDLAKVVAAIAEVPVSVAEAGLPELLENETWVIEAGQLIWPNYKHAQTCRKTDRLRKQDERERRATGVTERDSKSPPVTSGHPESPDVTLSLAKPSLAEPNLDKPPTPLPKGDRDVLEVFKHWQSVMNSPTSKLDTKRKRQIKAALKLGYTVGELERVATNVSQDKWLMGDNDRKTKWNSIDLIYRNADNIDKYLALERTNGASNGQQALTPKDEAKVKRRVKQLEAMGLERKTQ